MKVYVLIEFPDEENSYVLGVFSSQQKALDFWVSLKKESYWYEYLIQEFYLDEIKD